MNKIKFYLLSFLAIGIMAFSFTSCEEEEVVDAPTVTVFASVDGYQVAFTSTVTDVDTYAWVFGDDGTSTEANPVYTYTASGSYTATVTVTGEGGTAEASATVTISASELEMLTGTDAAGKTWVVSTIASEGDGIFKAFSPLEFESAIPSGILGMIGLATEYEDEFTFKPDGSYSHAVKNDSAMSNMLYCTLKQIPFRASGNPPVCLAPWAPAAATFTYTEDTDITMDILVEQDDDSELPTSTTWSGVGSLEISGGDEFLLIQDFTREYMILNISADVLQVGVFSSTTQIPDPSIMFVPKHVLVLSLVPKAK